MKKSHRSLKRAGPTANSQAGRFVRIRLENENGNSHDLTGNTNLQGRLIAESFKCRRNCRKGSSAGICKMV